VFRLLLDENLPAQLAPLLREFGFDVIHVRDAGLRSAPDEWILGHAALEERICITPDRDLHRLLAASGAEAPSVILLRNVELAASQLAALIRAAIYQVAGQSTVRFAATVTPRNVRLRPLPIGRKPRAS
jgi:predicted nuclease of predicted toxin-antitoxin system